jgi:hypothetical protein
MARGVGVEVGDDLPGGRLEARVAGATQPAVVQLEDPEPVPARERDGAVGRPVVAHDHFEIGIGAPLQRTKALLDGALFVVRTHHHGDPGPDVAPFGDVVPRPARHDVEGGLGLTFHVGDPEAPAVHLFAVEPPLVGPREHRCARAPRLVDLTKLRLDRRGLRSFAVHE